MKDNVKKSLDGGNIMQSFLLALVLLSSYACSHVCANDTECRKSLGRSTESFEKYGSENYSMSTSVTTYRNKHIHELKFVPNKQSEATIFFMPGFGAEVRDYVWIMKYWASKGSKVVGIDFPKDGLFETQNHEENAKQVLKLVEKYKNENPKTKLILSGHSRGAKIAFYTASKTSKVDAVIAFDPVNAGGPPCFMSDKCYDYPVASNPNRKQKGVLTNFNTPSLIFSVPVDSWNPDDQFHSLKFWNDLSKNAYLFDCENASHAAWYFEDHDDLAVMSMGMSSIFITALKNSKKADYNKLHLESLYPKLSCSFTQK